MSNLPNFLYFMRSSGYDYGNLPGNSRELAHLEYGGYDSNYDYNADYSNSGSYQPNEFFAESFRNYYTLDKEKNAKYRELIPRTFEFFDQLKSWTNEQNVRVNG